MVLLQVTLKMMQYELSVVKTVLPRAPVKFPLGSVPGFLQIWLDERLQVPTRLSRSSRLTLHSVCVPVCVSVYKRVAPGRLTETSAAVLFQFIKGHEMNHSNIQFKESHASFPPRTCRCSKDSLDTVLVKHSE